MSARVLVLGGGGFVGRHVVNLLVERSYRAIVPTRRREAVKHLILLPTVDVVEADINDPKTLAGLVRRCDAVVNLVGILGASPRADFEDAHVMLAANTVEACRGAGVRRLLHMSALNAAVDGPSEYLRSKGRAERVVGDSGLQWTIFRPSVIFGPEDAFLNMFARIMRWLPVIALAAPDARFKPVHVRDVASAFVSALDKDSTFGQCYSLCGPKEYSLRELVAYTAEVTGHRRAIVPLGPGLSRLTATVLEFLPGKLMSRDNLASMQKASVCAGPFPPFAGIEPTALEAIAPSYLSPRALRSAYDDMRASTGR